MRPKFNQMGNVAYQQGLDQYLDMIVDRLKRLEKAQGLEPVPNDPDVVPGTPTATAFPDTPAPALEPHVEDDDEE